MATISKEKLKIARNKAQNAIYEVMDDLDPTGWNSQEYKDLFSKMGDKEFIDMMKRVTMEEDFNFPFSIESFEKDGAPSLNKIIKVAEKHKVPLTEHVIMPHRNPGGPPMVTKDKVPILYLNVRRLQQMLERENASASNDEKRNPLTGQVVGESKKAALSDAQTYVLSTTNQTNSIREFLGPRGDDDVSNQEMINLIQKNGEVSLAELNLKTENKQSINTSETFLRGAGLNVRFNRISDGE